jgi:hypothetical protein
MNANANVDEARQLLQRRAAELRIELNKVEDAIHSLDESPARPNGNSRPARGRKTRRDQALDLIARNPGITIKELAASMGLNGPHYLYRVLPALEREKLIAKQGDGYREIRK